MQDNNQELLPLVDEEGNVIGSATRGQCHDGSKLLHPVVHLHLFDSEGRIYLQQRPLWKDIQPGKWDTAVGGHVDAGESVEAAARRELKEELGIEGSPEVFFTSTIRNDIESENVTVFKLICDGPFDFSREEIDEVRFFELELFRDECNRMRDDFTPNLQRELGDVIKMLKGGAK